ncbi:MAG: hypothetical protein KDH92_12925 [Chloroflexi bacterium]|nr:hypothetical protein [Chloroflexota bacterium]
MSPRRWLTPGRRQVLRLAGVASTLCVLGLGLSPALAAQLSGRWGGGNTSLWVQNLDPRSPSTVIARFYELPGDPPRPPKVVQRDNVPPWGVTIFDATNQGDALDQYAVIVESDRKAAAVNFTEEPFNDSAVAYTDMPISAKVVVPLALRGFTKQEGGTEVSSLVSVESVTRTSGLRATFYSRMWSWELENRLRRYSSVPNPPVTVSPAGSAGLATQRGEGGTWDIDLEDPAFDEPSRPARYEGSVGWMLLEAEPGNALTAESFASLSLMNRSPEQFDSFAVSAYPGVPIEQASNRLFVPLFRSHFFGITGISVVNPDPARSLRLRATYYVSPLSGRQCAGQAGGAVAHLDDSGNELVTVGPLESVVLYQLGRLSPPTTPRIQAPGSTGDPRLQPQCFGSAVIEVDPSTPGSIVAMVNDFHVDPKLRVATADAYQAVRYEETASTVAIPMVMHDARMPAGAIYPAASTGIQVMNVDDSPADVTLTVVAPAGAFRAGGPVASQTQRIEPYRAGTFYTGFFPELAGQTDFRGSAVVRSAGGQRLAVTVTVARGGKDSVTYNGFPSPSGSPIAWADGGSTSRLMAAIAAPRRALR